MFKIVIVHPGPDAACIDSAETVDLAMTRYAELGWEDPTSVLLSRTVIVREESTGEVHAIGTYRPHGGSTDSSPVLGFFLIRDGIVVRFTYAEDAKTRRMTVHRENYRVRS